MTKCFSERVDLDQHKSIQIIFLLIRLDKIAQNISANKLFCYDCSSVTSVSSSGIDRFP